MHNCRSYFNLTGLLNFSRSVETFTLPLASRQCAAQEDVNMAFGLQVLAPEHEFNLKDVSDGFNTSHIIHRLEWPSRCDTAVYIWPTITAERMMAAVSNNRIQREYLSHRFGQRVPGVESPLEAPELHATQKFRLSFRCSSASVVT